MRTGKFAGKLAAGELPRDASRRRIGLEHSNRRVRHLWKQLACPIFASSEDAMRICGQVLPFITFALGGQ